MKSLELEFAELWCNATLKGRGYKPTPALRRRLKSVARKFYFLPSLKDDCVMFSRRDSKNHLRAVVFIWKEKSLDSPKKVIRNGIVHSMPGDEVSLDWVKEVLSGQMHHLLLACKVDLQPWQISLTPWMLKKGIGIRSIRLGGHVKKSLIALRSHYGRSLRKSFDEDRMSLRPAIGREEVEAYLRIVQKVYRKNPQFGHFVADPKFLQFMRDDINSGIRRGKTALWLVYKENKLVGGADIIEFPKGLDGKSLAAFGVNLSSEVHGKGYARAIYETVLNDLASRGIETYFGNTAQPGVMRLGKIMNRQLLGVEMDCGIAKAFPRAHFKSWIPY